MNSLLGFISWCLLCMGPCMCSEETYISKALSTFITFKGLLSCMCSLVSLQISCLTKTLVTVVTFERFLSCMYSVMMFKIYRTTETLVTLVTFVRLLARKSHSPSLQIVSFTASLFIVNYHDNFLGPKKKQIEFVDDCLRVYHFHE